VSFEDGKYCHNDITGNKYNMLTALYRVENRGKQTYWRFRCDCGNEKEINKATVISGRAKSCGCYRVKATRERAKNQKPRGAYKHKDTDMTLYRVWSSMRSRCNNPNTPDYHNYGGRGIKVCERWDDYRNFVEDMLPGYESGLQIDRVDNDGDYEYSNCRWATRKQNSNNTRVNRRINTPDGRVLTMKQAAEEYNIPYTTLIYRVVHAGWDPTDALQTEVGSCMGPKDKKPS